MTTRNPSVPPRSDPAAPPMATIQAYNVVGTFRTRTDAQDALEQLRAHGVGGDDARLLGETEDLQPTRVGLPASETEVARSVAGNIATYAIAGAVILGIVGLVLTLIDPIRSGLGLHPGAGTVLGGLLLGAILGLVIGGLVGYVAGLDRSASGHDVYGDQIASGPTAVGLKAPTAEAEQRARTLLNDLGATDVAVVTPMQRGDG